MLVGLASLVAMSIVPVVDVDAPALVVSGAVTPGFPGGIPDLDGAVDFWLPGGTSLGVAASQVAADAITTIRLSRQILETDWGLSLGLALSGGGTIDKVLPVVGRVESEYWVQPALCATFWDREKTYLRASLGPLVSYRQGDWRVISNFAWFIPNVELAWRYHPNFELTLGGYALVGLRAIVPVEKQPPETLDWPHSVRSRSSSSDSPSGKPSPLDPP